MNWPVLSSGRLPGATYALYPGHIRAMVLDGPSNHDQSVRQLSGVEASSVEDGYDGFAG